jgi:two-component sensor histidine kinase
MAHLIPNQRARGFGSILTERSIVGQLGGKIEYDWQQSGIKLRITVPLDRLSV